MKVGVGGATPRERFSYSITTLDSQLRAPPLSQDCLRSGWSWPPIHSSPHQVGTEAWEWLKVIKETVGPFP